MPQPPGQSRASRAADSGAETGLGARWPEAGAGEPGTAESPDRRAGPQQTAGPGSAAGRWLRWGRLPAWAGVLMVAVAAALGAAFTVVSDREPGRALGTFVLVGALAGATSVRARSAYAIIPVPALAYAVAAAAAGSAHDHAVDTTRTALALSGVQWIAAGFIAMTAATALVMLITLARWLLSLRQGR